MGKKNITHNVRAGCKKKKKKVFDENRETLHEMKLHGKLRF